MNEEELDDDDEVDENAETEVPDHMYVEVALLESFTRRLTIFNFKIKDNFI